MEKRLNQNRDRMINMKNIKEYNLDELKEELISIGEKKYRAEQIFKWLYVDKVKEFDEMTNLSLELREKLKKEYSVFENTYKKLIEKDFEGLKEENKKSVINGLIDLMETGQGNLSGIGLTNREGRMPGRNFNTSKLINMTFIDKSVTGMYERRYKINGMENCYNK